MRYIYLMKERSKWWKPIKIVKIGIAADPFYRRYRIDAGITNKTIDLVEYRKVLWARSYERFLHYIFGVFRFKRRSRHPDIGRTEWFRLNFVFYGIVRFMIILPRVITLLLLIVIYELIT